MAKKATPLKAGLVSASATDIDLPEFRPSPHLSVEQAQLAHERFSLSYTLVNQGMQFFSKAEKPEDFIAAYVKMNAMLYKDEAIGPRLMKAFGFSEPASVGAAGEVDPQDANDGFAIGSAGVFFHNAAQMARTTLDPDDSYSDLKDEAGPGELLRQFRTILVCTENMRGLTSGRQMFLDEGEQGLGDFLTQARKARQKIGELLRPTGKG